MKGTYANGSLDRNGTTKAFVNGDNDSSRGDSPKAGVAELEKRLANIQQDFTDAMQCVREKENQKFDLIFAILLELQKRQGQLEESVRALNAQYGTAGAGGQMAAAGGNGSANMSQNSPQHPQFSNGESGDNHGFSQMSGQMNGNMGSQSPMSQQQQQFDGGSMQPDGSQTMFTAVPQVVVMASPFGGQMQYVMPQMMSPTGMMQPMQMQFMNQGQNGEMGNFVGGNSPQSGFSGEAGGTPGAGQDQQQQQQSSSSGKSEAQAQSAEQEEATSAGGSVSGSAPRGAAAAQQAEAEADKQQQEDTEEQKSGGAAADVAAGPASEQKSSSD